MACARGEARGVEASVTAECPEPLILAAMLCASARAEG